MPGDRADPYSNVPEELRSRFRQVFDLKIEHAPFDDDSIDALRKASKVACRTEDFDSYLGYSAHRVDMLVLLKKRKTRDIVSFAMVSIRKDIGVAVLSLICAAYDDNVSYGIVTHGILAQHLLAMGITEIALSSVNENEGYYKYLGYRQTQRDARGRILARTFDGRGMVMDDIAQSNLMKIFPQKLEKTLGVMQSLGEPITLNGQLRDTSDWQYLRRYWQHQLRHVSEVSMKELDWSYEQLPYASRMNVLESGWIVTYSVEDRNETLREADWVSSFELEKSDTPYPHAFVMAKEHGDFVELFPWVIHRLKSGDTSIPTALLALAAVLMLRSLKKKGFKTAFVVGSVSNLLKKMGFRVQKPWKDLIVPTSKDLYVLDLESTDLRQLTVELMDDAVRAHNSVSAMADVVGELSVDTTPVLEKENAKTTARLAVGRSRKYPILGGLAFVEVVWDTTELSFGDSLATSYVLNARIFLQTDADWSPPSRAKTILNQLKKAIVDNRQFSKIFPAVGYFAIVYEVEALSADADLDLRMSQFYSALALMKKPPQELKGIMAIALGTTLINELKRGTMLPNMTFGLEASGDLGGKDMQGLVDYYHNTLGLEVVRPDRLAQDLKDGNVIMMSTVSGVVDACTRRFQDLLV